LTAEVGGNKALLLNDYYVKTTVDNAIAEASEILLSKVGTVDANGNLVDLNAIVQNKYATKAEVVDGVKTAEATATRTIGTASSDIYSQLLSGALEVHTATEDAEAARAQNFAGYIETISSNLQEGISAEAIKREVLASVVANSAAILSQESITRATADSALSGLITTLGSKVDNNQASIVQGYYTKADTNSAIAASTRALGASIFQTDADGNVTTALQSQFQETIETAVDADGTARAAFASKTTVNGKTAGFGYDNDGNVSNFFINADRFAILGATAGEVNPFMVVDGVTYINAAMIKDASISSAKIYDLAATIATIAQASIYNAAIGGRIYSSNYNNTIKTGWSLEQDGSAFFGGNTTFAGKMEVRRVGSGAGVDITNDGIRVYDDAGVLRVAIGKLA